MSKTSKVAARPTEITVSALEVEQGEKSFFLFKMKASELMTIAEVNRREEGQEEGYQRVVSPSRVRAIARYIEAGGIIPGAVVISADKGTYDKVTKELTIVGRRRAAWVIDGQHRLIGAWEASRINGENDIELAVIAFLNADLEPQIELFVTINREAKGVPASLYLDLLKDLPRKKTEKEILDERITDIARRLYNDESSPFFPALDIHQNCKVW